MIGRLDATLSVTASVGEMADENEDEGRYCAYLCDTITDGSLDGLEALDGLEGLEGLAALEEAPRIDIPKGLILTFLMEILVKYVCDEIPASDATANDMFAENNIGNYIRNRIDSLGSEFFCSDEYVCKCRDAEPEIDGQMEIWNFLIRNIPKRFWTTSSRKSSQSFGTRPRNPVAKEAFGARRGSWGICECEAIVTCFGRD
jgi:hypothetical protein